MVGDDAVLAAKIKNGDPQSLKVLYNRYHKKLYYLAKGYLENEHLAEDAVQDIFLKFWNNRQHLKSTSSIDGLLFKMLKNHVLNTIRDEKNHSKILEGIKKTDQSREFANTVMEEVIYSEYENLFQKALTKLTPAQQEVFELRRVKGLSNSEVAEHKGVSENTVKTHYYLGSKFIRNYLKKHGGVLGLMIIIFSSL